MATQTITYTSYDTSTTAGVRAFGANVSSALTMIGLTKTTDTGQIDWTTVTNASQSLGYEVWRFNDTLQSSAPVYLKISYTLSNSLWFYISSIQVGQATNGAGTLSGLTNTLGYTATTSTTGTGTGNWTWRFVYNAALGFFGVSQWDDPATNSSGPRSNYLVARACDSSGSPTTSGLWLQAFGVNNSLNGTYIAASYDANASITYNNSAVPGFSGASTLMVGTTAQFLRQTPAYPTLRTVPQILYYANPDIPRGTIVTLSPYGTSHTYVTLGIYSTNWFGAFAMLWE